MAGWFGYRPGPVARRSRGRRWGRARGGGPVTHWSPGVDVVDDVEPAAWIAPRLRGWGAGPGTRVGAVVPTGFDAYARLPHPVETGEETWTTWEHVARHTGRTAHAGMQWETITHQRDGTVLEVGGRPLDTLPRHLVERLVSTLGRHTTTPNRCWFAVWEGYGDLPASDTARLRLPGRRYVLLSGSLEMVTRPLWRHASGLERFESPNLWWPEDRAWVVGTEIDFDWTYVAGSAACVQSLLDDEEIEAYATSVDDRGDLFGDDINPLPPDVVDRDRR